MKGEDDEQHANTTGTDQTAAGKKFENLEALSNSEFVGISKFKYLKNKKFLTDLSSFKKFHNI